MKHLIILFLAFTTYHAASAQYVYTIKADSVKLTNCDSTELIIENHTQGVVGGFLYNTNTRGRTIFKRPLTKVNNSLYLIGLDSLQIPGNAWVQGGNSFGTTGILGTKDNNHLDFYVNNSKQMRLDSVGHLLLNVPASTAIYYKLEVSGGVRVDGYQMFTGSSDPLTNMQIHPGSVGVYGMGLNGSVLSFGTGTIGTNLQAVGNIPQYSIILGGVSPNRYTTLVDYYFNPVFVVDGGGSATINGGYLGIGNGGSVAGSPDVGGPDFKINGPRGTGAGRTGDIILSTATSTGSGMTIHTMTNRWWLKGGTGYLANTSTPTSSIDVTGTTGYSQFRMRTSYTPTATADTNGNVGDFSWDGNYFYIKTPAGWKRSALTTF